jgi:hypothetical protein
MDHAAKVRRELLVYLLVLCGLTAIAMLIVYVRGTVLGQPYPFNTVLYNPDIRYFDLTIYDLRFWSFLSSGDFFGPRVSPYAYPAPAVFATLPFYMLSDVAVVPFLVVILAAIWLATFFVWLRLRGNTSVYLVATSTLLVTAATSYPFYMLMDRGNIEGLIWILLALGLAAFAADRNWLAAFLIGAAASMKPFPGLLLLLLLTRRKYKEFAFGGVTFVVINLAAMRALTGSIVESWNKLSSGFSGFAQNWVYAYRPREIGIDHSLFSVLKQIVHLKQKYPQLDHTMESIHLVYFVLVFGSFAVAYLLYFRKLPILNQLFLLVIASTLFPYVAYDYTLVQLYLPWGAFLIFLCSDVASGRANLTQSQAMRILLPCTVVFTPQTYVILVKGINCGGQIKALALLALMHAALTIPMPTSVFGELPEPDAARDEDRKRNLQFTT